MTVVTTAEVGVEVDTVWLDVFPAFFYSHFGTPVGGSGTSTTPVVGESSTTTAEVGVEVEATWLPVVPAFVYAFAGTPVGGSGTSTTAEVG